MSDLTHSEQDTPFGRIYRPKAMAVQIVLLVLAFFGGPALGGLIGDGLGGLSKSAQIVLTLPFVAIFFLGYGLWAARLQAIAFNAIGRGILKALFLLLIRRRKPENLQDVIPSQEKLLKMAVGAQKAAWSFQVVAFPIAFAAVLAALLFDSPAGALDRMVLVGGGCLGWGFTLGLLGRRGYLPIMEESG